MNHTSSIALGYESACTFTVSVFTATTALGKRIERNAKGEIEKTPLANMHAGTVEQRSFASLSEFGAYRSSLSTSNALAYGQCQHARASVVTQRKARATAGGSADAVVCRDSDHFTFAASRPGVLMLDYDPPPDSDPLTADALVAAVREAVPALRAVTMLWAPSASSCIFDADTGEQVARIAGQRLYILVQEARDIPAAGELIFKRCVLAGHGSIKFARDGGMLTRTIVDASVWQPERLDFVRATCGPGLAQRQTAPRLIEAEDMPADLFGDSVLDVSTLPPITQAESERITSIWRDLKARAHDKSDRRRREWAKAKAAEDMPGATPADIEARAAEYAQAMAQEREALPGHFVLTAENGTLHTVQELLDNRARFNEKRFADPVEPGADKRVAVAYLIRTSDNNDGPAIFSHLHGGRWFQLVDLSGFDEVDTEQASTPAEDEREGQADVELSRRLVPMLKAAAMLYVHDGPGWVQWRAGVYRPCVMGEQVEVAKRLGQRILQSAADAQDEDKAKRHMRLASRAMSRQGIEAAVALARSDPRVSARLDEFDADPDLLNVANGCVHLPSATLQPHAAEQRFMRQCAVAYDPQAQAPTFERVLREIACSDADWIDHFHRLIGYSLSGRVTEEKAVFLLGGGANGKSTLCNIVWHIAADYRVAVPSAFLCQDRDPNPNAPTPGLSSLRGSRIAFANEVEYGMRLSAKTLKEVSSADPIATRDPHAKQAYSFQPTHTLWVRGNHKPIIRDTDNGIWRRLVLLPFDREFGPDEKDVRLDKKLVVEAPGIFAWMVRGYLEYLQRGLKPSPRAAGALLTYRDESDLVGQWLADCCVVDPTGEVEQRAAYFSYEHWCRQQNLTPMAQKSLTGSLAARGYVVGQQSKPPRMRVYRGMVLTADVGGGGVPLF